MAGAGRVWWVFLLTGSSGCCSRHRHPVRLHDGVSPFRSCSGSSCSRRRSPEAATAFWAHGWSRLLRGLLALAFLVIAIVSFVHPGDTFKALAAVMSFYFVLKGTFDIAIALATRPEDDLWWMGLTLGIVEVLLGFWAAGDFGHKVSCLSSGSVPLHSFAGFRTSCSRYATAYEE